MTRGNPDDVVVVDRRDELLIDALLGELDLNDEHEFDELGLSDDSVLAEYGPIISDLQCLGPKSTESIPVDLEQAILEDARSLHVNGASMKRTPTPRNDSIARTRIAWAGWLLATGLAVMFALPLFDTSERAPSPIAVRKELLQQDSSLAIDWTQGEDAAAKNASGSIVWNNDSQKGVMRFVGLPVNDPTQYQYQLWIFDAEQDDRYPVDGGVFDITNENEAYIPIVAKLDVRKPTLFAITIEKPGGVVVSSRERLPLLAPVPQS